MGSPQWAAVRITMVSLAAECQTFASRLMLGLRMCVEGDAPLGRRGTPSIKIARLVLSCAPASEMRAPLPRRSIAAADVLRSKAAIASQLLGS